MSDLAPKRLLYYSAILSKMTIENPTMPRPVIQWFPGHMQYTRRMIEQRMPDIDVVIEILDARLPGSSANIWLQQLTDNRPRLKLLNKSDCADPVRTTAWLAWYNAQSATRALPTNASDRVSVRVLEAECRALAPQRGGLARPLRVMICGVPNVGKSTLINAMTAKTQAKTADEAGVTREEQRIVLADDFYLWDTPGMLWPRIHVPQSGFNLAASGSVGRNAYDEELVALELLAYLKKHYAERLCARYQLMDDNLSAISDELLLELIGAQRGCKMAGGRVNTQKAADMILTDYRNGYLGRITLETPEEFENWCKIAEENDAKRAQEKAVRDKERRKKSAKRF